jgi:hypothetical protein
VQPLNTTRATAIKNVCFAVIAFGLAFSRRLLMIFGYCRRLSASVRAQLTGSQLSSGLYSFQRTHGRKGIPKSYQNRTEMVGAATSSSYSGCTTLRVGPCRQSQKNPRTIKVTPDAKSVGVNDETPALSSRKRTTDARIDERGDCPRTANPRPHRNGIFSMSKPAGNILFPIAFVLGCLFAISVALFYPGYASDAGILGMLVFLEIV